MRFKTIAPIEFVIFLLFVLVLVVTACDAAPTKPTVVIVSPPHGSQYREGEQVTIQSAATDAAGITRVELLVDGAVVRTDPSPQSQPTFTLIQTWKMTQGAHTISVIAYNSKGVASAPAAVSITAVVAQAQAPSPTTTIGISRIPRVTDPPPTVRPPTVPPTNVACANNAAFVADVTVPDGTQWVPNQTFNKIWRVRNSGTCAWGAGYQFAFVGGASLAATNSYAVPQTAPGATADLLVAMQAPATSGAQTAQWRMKDASGALFGATMSVNIIVVSASAPPSAPPAATGCSGTPNIESFTASPSSIVSGHSSTLSWGAVTGADSVEIDNDIGGVATPGTASVSPTKTTTYTLTARCGSTLATKQATVTVPRFVIIPTLGADLYVSDLAFTPNPPNHTASVQVRVTIANKNNVAVSAPFTVQWWHNSKVTDPDCTWTVSSLAAKGSKTLECNKGADLWPSGYAKITTRVKIDTGGKVTEADESNNTYDEEIQVK